MKNYAIYIIPVALVIGLIWFGASQPSDTSSQSPAASQEQASDDGRGSSDTRALAMSCVNHGPGASYHIHPRLGIVIDGERLDIPANIGVTPTCMNAIHTHDGSGKLHVEYPTPQDFTLGDFFTVWGKDFSENKILGHEADENHRIKLTVNGSRSEAYEDLVLKDGDVIVISYEKVE